MFNFKVDLIRDNILKASLLFAIPIFISNVFQSLYNMMDIAVVSNLLGEVSLSAIGSCSALYNMLMNFALGLGNGFTIVLGRYYGSNDEATIKKGMSYSMVIGIVLSTIFLVYTFTGLKPTMALLNIPANIIDESYSYLAVIIACSIVMFMYNLFSAALRAIGNSTMPLVFLIVSSLLNIGFNIISIKVFHLGVTGTAIATVISQGISAILCVLYIVKKARILIPDFKAMFTFDKKLYKEMIGQGLSMAMMMTIVAFGSVILSSGINSFGESIIAAHTTASTVSRITMMPLLAISTALSTFVSHNKGAKNNQRIIDGVRINTYVSLVWSALSILFAFTLGTKVCQLVSGSNNVELLSNASLYIAVYNCFYPVLGVLFNLRNTLQGLGRKITPLISSVIELIGKIIFTMLIIPRIGYLGVIFCEPIIWCIMTLELSRSYKKQKSLLLKELAK